MAVSVIPSVVEIEESVFAPLKPFFVGRMPLPPSVNMAYKIIKTRDSVRIGSTPALQNFKEEAAITLMQAEADWSLINAIRDSKRRVPLKAFLRVYFRKEWKRDLDGSFKYCIDAAFMRMQLDDVLVVRLEAESLIDPIEPRVEIEISCLLSR